MQHDRMHRSVLGVGLLLAFHILSLSATTLEDLLSAQDAHEASAHTDFVSWCKGAQSALTDRVTARKEHIDELTGAIAGYSAKIDQLRNSTKKNMQPLGALSQEQRLQLIETESQHWRSVHAKDAAERLLEAHRDLLEGVEGAMQWEQQALDHHQAERQQLIAMVHEHQLQQSIEARPVVETPTRAAPSTAPPVVAAPVVAAPAIATPTVTAAVAAPLPPVPEVQLVNLLPATPPLIGITQLPALQLMQADDLKVPLPAERAQGLMAVPVPQLAAPAAAAAAMQSPLAKALQTPALNPLLSLASMSSRATAQVVAFPAAAADPTAPAGLVATVQAWFKPAIPATALAVRAATPVVPVIQSAPVAVPVAPIAAPVAAPIVVSLAPIAAPVAALAGVSVVPTAAPVVTPVIQAASVVVPVTPTVVPVVPTVVQAAPAVVPVSQATPAVVPALPTAAPVVATVVQAPAVVTVAPAAAPVVATVAQAAADVPVAPTKAPLVAAAVQAEPALVPVVQSAPDVAQVVQEASPVPTPVTVQPAAANDKSASVQSHTKTSATKANNEDPEDALMAIMTGSTSAEITSGSHETNAKAHVSPAAPRPEAKAPKPSAAFLQKTAPAPSPPAPSDPAPSDPEDALMEVMMQKAISEDPVVAATGRKTTSLPKTPEHASQVLALMAQTAPAVQQMQATPGIVRTAPPVQQGQAAPVTIQTAPTVKQARAASPIVPTAPAVQEVRAAAPTVPTAPAAQQVRATPAIVQSTPAVQRVQATAAAVKSASNPEVPRLKMQATLKKQPAADSEAGVMQSFVQDVADLAQGEPGQSQVDPAAPALEAEQVEETQESQAHMVSSFVQEVSRLAQGEPSSADIPVTSSPTTETGLTLSSDLASLMGLSSQSPPASFLQIKHGSRRMRRALSRSELAAASLIRDLDSSEISKRLGRTVSQSSVESNVQMLTALNEELHARKFHWACTRGPVAAHSMAVLQLAETGTSLLMAERDTVASLSAELRDTQAASAQLKAEFITRLEQTFGQGYEAARADLESLPLAQIRSESPVGASAIAALEDSLRSDAVGAKQLAAKWVDRGSEYVRLGDDLLQTSSSRDSELQKASRVLSDARARAATMRGEAAKEPGCSNAARTSGLIAAVYKALHILSDRMTI